MGLENREHIGSLPNAPSCPLSDARTHDGEPAAINLTQKDGGERGEEVEGISMQLLH